MEEFIKLGLRDIDFNSMLEINPSIKEMSSEEINKYVIFLSNIGCEDRHIRNIIITNPFYFNRDVTDLVNLVHYLTKVGFTNLYLLFDSNPFLLNKDDFEINDFFNEKFNSGMNIEDIRDLIDSNPYIIDEI